MAILCPRCLELGGNDAAVILNDADMAAVAPWVFDAAMLIAGQVCLAVKRVYAPRQMVDAYAPNSHVSPAMPWWTTGVTRVRRSARSRTASSTTRC